MKGILITSVEGKELQIKKIVKEIKDGDAEVQIFTCDMSLESVSGLLESDSCFKVPICTSEDYVETIFSLCLGYNISRIIAMTEKEFIILSANKEMFGKYGIEVKNSLVIK